MAFFLFTLNSYKESRADGGGDDDVGNCCSALSTSSHQHCEDRHGNLSRVERVRLQFAIPRGAVPAALLSRTIHTVLTLCHSRKDLLGNGSVLDELGAYVDVSSEDASQFAPDCRSANLSSGVQGLPEYMIKTRLVLTEVMNELSILQCCLYRWGEVLRVVEARLG
jgi:hypothetical protein